MNVDARTTILRDARTGASRLAIAGFGLTRAERAAAMVARIRYPSRRFEHHLPRWNGITGWLSARQGARLFDLARSLDAVGDVVEIGSAFGRSTVALGLGTRARGGGKVYGVDPHTGGIGLAQQYGPLAQSFSSLGPFLQNIVRFGLEEVIVPVVLPSARAAEVWPGRPVRLLFIDGWHDYDECSRDILAWGRWVSPGGVIAVHDYDWAEVRRAVEDHLPKLGGFGAIEAEDPNMAVVRREAQ